MIIYYYMNIDYLQILIYSLLPTTFGTLFTLYISERVKGSVKNNFDTRLEKLKNSHNIEMSKFQAEINSLKARENFKFTKLHERRFEIFGLTYKLINEVLSELHRYINPIKFFEKDKNFIDNDNSLQRNFLSKHSEFITYYNNNRLYFDSDTKRIIDNYLKDVNEAYDLYNEQHFYRQMGERPDGEMMRKAVQAFKNIELKITPIKENIEIRFSEILEK